MSTPANPPQFVRRAALGLAATAPLLKSQHVTAAEGGAVAVIPAFANPPRRVPADHFTGEVQVSSPFQSHAPARANGGIVTFAPGARTAWHTHPLGQTLVVLTGAGMVQRWGDPAHHIGIGDVVWIPPGVKHWHGAGPTGAMSHLAISEALDGRTADWAEHVTDTQYTSAADRPQ